MYREIAMNHALEEARRRTRVGLFFNWMSALLEMYRLER
jgi:hypothetical protein